MPGHGLNTIPGTLTSLADVPEEMQSGSNICPPTNPPTNPPKCSYSNNVGFYRQKFYLAPPATGFVGSPPPGRASVDIGKVDLSASRITPQDTIAVSATLLASGVDASGVSANFYDGDPEQGGRLFDVERIPHIAQDEPYSVQASYRTNTCGTHELFVVVNEGKSSQVVRRAHLVRVDCGSSK